MYIRIYYNILNDNYFDILYLSLGGIPYYLNVTNIIGMLGYLYIYSCISNSIIGIS